MISTVISLPAQADSHSRIAARRRAATGVFVACGGATRAFGASAAARVLGAALAAVLLLGACGEKKDKAATQAAARVNKEEITVHQINFVLQQQRGLKPEQADAAGKQVLERLIDQELALQRGAELKLDRDPRVVQQLDAARRDVLARAYYEKVGEAAAKPTADEVRNYYDEQPALFKERRIYNLQELNIEARPDQLAGLRDKLVAARTLNDFVEWLRANDFKFQATQAIRAAEQLPLASLATFAKLQDGQSLMNPTPNGAQVVLLANSRSQPIDLERATPSIEQFLLNDRRRKLIEDDTKQLRNAATIQYLGKFEAPAAAASQPAAPGVAASAAAPAPAAAPASAPGGLDASSITKGMGIK